MSSGYAPQRKPTTECSDCPATFDGHDSWQRQRGVSPQRGTQRVLQGYSAYSRGTLRAMPGDLRRPRQLAAAARGSCHRGVLNGYSRGTQRVLTGYSRVLTGTQGYSRGTLCALPGELRRPRRLAAAREGYSTGTLRPLAGTWGGILRSTHVQGRRDAHEGTPQYSHSGQAGCFAWRSAHEGTPQYSLTFRPGGMVRMSVVNHHVLDFSGFVWKMSGSSTCAPAAMGVPSVRPFARPVRLFVCFYGCSPWRLGFVS
jgi:hypothetical protein